MPAEVENMKVIGIMGKVCVEWIIVYIGNMHQSVTTIILPEDSKNIGEIISKTELTTICLGKEHVGMVSDLKKS